METFRERQKQMRRLERQSDKTATRKEIKRARSSESPAS